MSCTCEPGAPPLPHGHAPWDCLWGPPGWDEDERLCPSCGYSGINPDCPDHGHLADVPDEDAA